MSQPFVGEIRMFGGSFAPAGWAMCQGQLMPISENETLFNLIGTTYGGDGQETFALPNLSGRVPLHQGQGPGITQNYQIGEAAGVESVTLTTQQTPAHNHSLLTTAAPANTSSPQSALLADEAVGNAQATTKSYKPGNANQVALHQNSVGIVGGNQPHENMQPYLAVTFIISLFGIFPTQN